MTIDMKGLTTLITDAAHKRADAAAAGAHALTVHQGYAPAIKAYELAIAAEHAVLDKCQAIVQQLIAQDKSGPPFNTVDPSWYSDLSAKQNEAWAAIQSLVQGYAAVKASLLAYVQQLQLSPAQTATPAAQAAAVDAAAKATPTGNPNTKTPDAQTATAPPVQTPPTDAAAPDWVMPAVLVAGAAIVAKLAGVF